MKQSLSIENALALGMMLFAFFLGAGNVIFPPMAGQLAGDHFVGGMLGFLVTAVGLPLIAVIALAIRGGTWNSFSQDLPVGLVALISWFLYLTIGPCFATPRTGLVAYEIAIEPFIQSPSMYHLMIFSVIFFTLVAVCCLLQGRLVDLIGKILTPVLMIALVVLAVSVWYAPQGGISPAQGDYITHPFFKGLIEGYNTMDIFGSLMFGGLIVSSLHSNGIKDPKLTACYLIVAGCLAAAALSLVYISLFYLGATSLALAPHAADGAPILSAYVQALFGDYGRYMLSTIVLLACFTTAVGLISACSDYFHQATKNKLPLRYPHWVGINCFVAACITLIGFAELMKVLVPVLLVLYPIAIALVMLAFMRAYLSQVKIAYTVVVIIATLFAIIDAAKVLDIEAQFFSFLPGFEYGLGWLVPTIISSLVFIRPRKMSC